MSYSLFISRSAQKEFFDIDKKQAIKIKVEILKLSENPRPAISIKLKNREGWRIKVGNYRVLYEILDDSQVINILHVGHRKDVYKH